MTNGLPIRGDAIKIMPIESVGSDRSRSLAESCGRFITDKTLLLSESGKGK